MENRNELVDIMVDKLRDAHSAEQQGMRFLKRCSEMLGHEGLRDMVESHIEISDRQLKRLQRGLEMLDAKADRRVCISMQSTIAEVEQEIGDTEGPLLDAMFVLSQQKIEHLEVAAYAALETMALAMGEVELAMMMGASLDEEKTAISMLGTMAKHEILSQMIGQEPGRGREQQKGRVHPRAQLDEGREEEEREDEGNAARQAGQQRSKAPAPKSSR